MTKTKVLSACFTGVTLLAFNAHADGLLGLSDPFAVLAGSAVTNTGPSVINGSLGVSPGIAVSGFPPGVVINGIVDPGDAVASAAQGSLTLAYNVLAGLPSTGNLTGQDLGGLNLIPGVYFFASSAQLTGTLNLNAQGNDNAVWVFQIGSTLTTASNASVQIVNGGPDGGVNDGIYWQVGSSATLGTDTTFEGNIVALTSITLTTGATIPCGRALAENGAVTLDTNNISISCGGPGSPGSGGAGGFDSVGTPEPSSYTLVLPALGALFLRHKRRRVRAAPPS